MSEHLPDSFDPDQPDLPSLGVDPDPLPEDHPPQAATTQEPQDDAEGAS